MVRLPNHPSDIGEDSMAIIYPSLLAADQNKLEAVLHQLDPLVPGFHVDIIDNVFAPNNGISVEKINILAQLALKPLWVHLMVADPESYLDTLKLKPNSIVTFHLESHKHVWQMLEKIQSRGYQAGIALKPKTSVNEVFPFLAKIQQVLIMSVEPGFSGQPFLPETLAKVDPLVGQRDTAGLSFKIAMDGGIGINNIVEIAKKGVDQLAVGSEIFDHAAGPAEAYKILSAKIA